MAHDVEMPALGESVTEGTVSRWLKEVGDTVTAEEPLLEVSTDKVDSEVPAPADGVVLEILVQEDETVDVGTVVCRIGAPDEAGASTGSTSDDSTGQAPVPSATQAAVQSSDGSGSQAPQAPAPASEAEVLATTPAGSPAVDSSSSPAGDAPGVEVKMPALGESVSEGTVSRWLKEVGDTVTAEEPIVEVSTDKVDSEVPAPADGTIVEILVKEDETVDVGAVLCRIGDASQVSAGTSGNDSSQAPATPAPSQPAPAAPSAPKPPAPPAPPAAPSGAVPGGEIPSSIRKEGQKNVVEWAYPQPGAGYSATMKPEGQVVPPGAPKPKAPKAKSGGYVTPIVRKLAKEQGIDLADVVGSGVGGRIRKEDVLKAAAAKKAAAVSAPPAAPPAPKAKSAVKESSLRGQTQKMPGIRKAIAKAMMTSLQSTAQLTTVIEVDVTRIAQLRAKAKNSFLDREGTKLTFLPFFIKAATEALKAHPKINARVDDKTNQVTYFDYENVGIAVDSPKGLMVPVIKNCGDLTIAGIAKKTNELAAKVRDGKIKPDELSGGTFTITNTGSVGALFDTPVVNYPEEAILGLGGIVRRPVVIKDADGNDTIAIRSMCYLSLSYDHRLIDGADASRYLVAVKKRLEEGDFGAEVGL